MRLKALVNSFTADNIDITEDDRILFKLFIEADDYTDIQEEKGEEEEEEGEPNIMIQINDYLEIIIPQLREKIDTFIMSHTTSVKKNKINNILNTIGIWEERGENLYMTKEDETDFFSARFLKQSIINMATVYPAIIVNKVNYTNPNVPNHWNLSLRHKRDIQSIISSEFANLRRFYENEILLEILPNIKKSTSYILEIIDVLPFFARTTDANILYGGSIYNSLMHYYYLRILDAYIEEKSMGPIPKKSGGGGGGEVGYAASRREDIIRGEEEVMETNIADLMVAYLLMFQNNKDTINKNNEKIKEKVLKSREREKNKMTRQLGELTPQEREIENLLKNHRLGKWSIGLTRALFEYDESQYEKEMREIEKDELRERQLDKMENITTSNRDILKLDVIAEEQAKTAMMQEAFDISAVHEEGNEGETETW